MGKSKLSFLVIGLSLVLSGFGARGARADLRCKILKEAWRTSERPTCACLRLKVNCGGKIGWAEGEEARTSAGNVDFQGDQVRLYDRPELYDERKLVATLPVPESHDPASCPQFGTVALLQAKVAACENRVAQICLFPTNCPGPAAWVACKATENGACPSSIDECRKKALNPKTFTLSAPELYPSTEEKAGIGNGQFAGYLPNQQAILSFDPSKLVSGCGTHDLTQLCLAQIGIFEKKPDGSYADLGSSSRIACTVETRQCSSLAACTMDLQVAMGTPSFAPPPGGAGKGKGGSPARGAQ